MEYKLLQERIKWGTVAAIGLALSMVTSFKNIDECTSSKANTEKKFGGGIKVNNYQIRVRDLNIFYLRLNSCLFPHKITSYYIQPFILVGKAPMQLQDIYIYPIKSLGGIRVSEAQVEVRGFQLDRRWMLADEKGHFLSQRNFQDMALLQVMIGSNGLKVIHKQQPELTHWFPFEPETKDFIPVTIWEDRVMGQIVNKVSNEWFSQVLDIPCQLVHMPLSTERHIDKKYAAKEETVSFADAMPYLVIGQQSLNDLNHRLPVPVPMNRFRPNLVFSGGEAFQEDHWNRVKIGECIFKVAKPSARCVMTTVDQSNAMKSKEPLKTLAKYRTSEKKILFGQNLIALTMGSVKVGDLVQQV